MSLCKSKRKGQTSENNSSSQNKVNNPTLPLRKDLKLNTNFSSNTAASDFSQLFQQASAVNRARKTGFTYDIALQIHYSTVFGEKIVVTGSNDLLGKWDPLKGLELEWNPDDIWTMTISVCEGCLLDFEYKYVCIKHNSFHWENGPNRTGLMNEFTQQGSRLIYDKQDIWSQVS